MSNDFKTRQDKTTLKQGAGHWPSEALDGQLQSCYAARARPKCLTEEKCF